MPKGVDVSKSCAYVDWCMLGAVIVERVTDERDLKVWGQKAGNPSLEKVLAELEKKLPVNIWKQLKSLLDSTRTT